ncbi:MAG: phenylalanine--tRNA ligase subunit beta, partial [Erysipelotrichaceae bacterium]|nr:phenylalanine--tRNA ligase subunit beta [Erysipelotrichaceae bacterium]
DKLGYQDTILDLTIYANRPDCLSMFAMAKEIAAILDRPCTLPEYEGSAQIGEKGNFALSSATGNCPHFLAKVVNKVVLKPSPEWIVRVLKANGIKAINNLVDISNLVMLETGQPLHFYDLRSNPHREITVRDDYEGEYTALDGIVYDIKKGDMMITSNGEPIGIAGIMGGDATKILEDTTGLIIEAALFDHAQIRRTANRLGLMTEAASRFSKGLEPLAQKKAVDRAVQLLKEYAEADGFEETVEYGSDNYTPVTVTETMSHLNSLIGKQYKVEEVVDVLRRLDFAPEVDGEAITAHIPSYRTDITIREDIDEEVARLTDFDDLEGTLPYMPQTIGTLSVAQAMRRNIRSVLLNNGLQEVMTYTLVSGKMVEDAVLPLGKPVEVLSPLSEARRYVRNSLMPSILETLSYNLDHYNENVNLFEISKVYAEGLEQERLAVVLEGSILSSSVMHLNIKADFYVLKGLLMDMLDKLGYEKGRVTVKENTLDTVHFHPYRSCEVVMEGKTLAILGALHPSYAKKNKLPEVYYLEMNMDLMVSRNPAKTKAPVVSRYPSVSRDISLLVREDVKAEDLLKAAKKAGGALVKSTSVFDVYQGEHILTGFKSISLNIVYEAKDHTLKAEEITPVHEKILEELSKKFEANLRS